MPLLWLMLSSQIIIIIYHVSAELCEKKQMIKSYLFIVFLFKNAFPLVLGVFCEDETFFGSHCGKNERSLLEMIQKLYNTSTTDKAHSRF